MGETTTTQGDPMEMAAYAQALLSLVSLLWDELRHAWFADEALGISWDRYS